MEKHKEVERSIIKRFRKDIWTKFIKAVKEYELINESDKIMVCISGGKDSFLLAKCMEELHKYSKVKFDVVYVVMNPGYKEENIKKIEDNAKLLNINIEIFNSNIFEVVDKISENNPCYLCAKMRRGFLYNRALELGCNKIALGHHFDDVIETTLLNMLYAGEVKTMLPKLHSENFEGLELIRPLYLVKEEAIKSFIKYNDLSFINCACKFTERSSHENISKRKEVKELIKSLKAINKDVDNNIFRSLCNVNLNGILEYHNDEENFNFLDKY